jgi:fused signal recognition particle receptor
MAFDAFRRLFQGLSRTREGIATTVRGALGAHAIDDAALDDLESALLGADLGPALSGQVIESLRRRARKEGLDAGGLRSAVHEALRSLLPDAAARPERPVVPPKVVYVVGVNGGGKTTTVGKLARRERDAGRSVLVVAADTFRAAAIDQLERWGERAGVEVIKQKEGADPSAVVFDGLRAARARGIDTVVVDTAGRLHTKTNLMAELDKMTRIAAREVEGAPHESLLVVDATTGQNGIAQAREFTKAGGITGVVLTKLDGTAKGGVALAIHRELGVPIRYVGVGETVDDLLDFDPEAFVRGILGEDAAAA